MNTIILFLITLSFQINTQAKSLSLGLLGFTYHNIPVSKDIAQQMPRKITSDGLLVWHPEFNLTFKNNESMIFNATLVSDCMGKDAYFLGAGREWDYQNHALSLVVGIYATEKVKNQKGIPSFIPKDQKYNYFPTPWIGYSYSVPLSQDTSLFFQINTNYFLIHSVTGLKFNF